MCSCSRRPHCDCVIIGMEIQTVDGRQVVTNPGVCTPRYALVLREEIAALRREVAELRAALQAAPDAP